MGRGGQFIKPSLTLGAVFYVGIECRGLRVVNRLLQELP
jgi:hypothetical protein